MTVERRNEIIKRVESAFKEIFNNVENGYAIYQLPIEVPYKFRGWNDVTEFNVFNKNELIASIDFKETRKIREDKYNLYI
jgi:hypothetical protein